MPNVKIMIEQMLHESRDMLCIMAQHIASITQNHEQAWNEMPNTIGPMFLRLAKNKKNIAQNFNTSTYQEEGAYLSLAQLESNYASILEATKDIEMMLNHTIKQGHSNEQLIILDKWEKLGIELKAFKKHISKAKKHSLDHIMDQGGKIFIASNIRQDVATSTEVDRKDAGTSTSLATQEQAVNTEDSEPCNAETQTDDPGNEAPDASEIEETFFNTAEKISSSTLVSGTGEPELSEEYESCTSGDHALESDISLELANEGEQKNWQYLAAQLTQETENDETIEGLELGGASASASTVENTADQPMPPLEAIEEPATRDKGNQHRSRKQTIIHLPSGSTCSIAFMDTDNDSNKDMVDAITAAAIGYDNINSVLKVPGHTDGHTVFNQGYKARSSARHRRANHETPVTVNTTTNQDNKLTRRATEQTSAIEENLKTLDSMYRDKGAIDIHEFIMETIQETDKALKEMVSTLSVASKCATIIGVIADQCISNGKMTIQKITISSSLVSQANTRYLESKSLFDIDAIKETITEKRVVGSVHWIEPDKQHIQSIESCLKDMRADPANNESVTTPLMVAIKAALENIPVSENAKSKMAGAGISADTVMFLRPFIHISLTDKYKTPYQFTIWDCNCDLSTDDRFIGTWNSADSIQAAPSNLNCGLSSHIIALELLYEISRIPPISYGTTSRDKNSVHAASFLLPILRDQGWDESLKLKSGPVVLNFLIGAMVIRTGYFLGHHENDVYKKQREVIVAQCTTIHYPTAQARNYALSIETNLAIMRTLYNKDNIQKWMKKEVLERLNLIAAPYITTITAGDDDPMKAVEQTFSYLHLLISEVLAGCHMSSHLFLCRALLRDTNQQNESTKSLLWHASLFKTVAQQYISTQLNDAISHLERAFEQIIRQYLSSYAILSCDGADYMRKTALALDAFSVVNDSVRFALECISDLKAIINNQPTLSGIDNVDTCCSPTLDFLSHIIKEKHLLIICPIYTINMWAHKYDLANYRAKHSKHKISALLGSTSKVNSKHTEWNTNELTPISVSKILQYRRSFLSHSYSYKDIVVNAFATWTYIDDKYIGQIKLMENDHFNKEEISNTIKDTTVITVMQKLITKQWIEDPVNALVELLPPSEQEDKETSTPPSTIILRHCQLTIQPQDVLDLARHGDSKIMLKTAEKMSGSQSNENDPGDEKQTDSQTFLLLTHRGTNQILHLGPDLFSIFPRDLSFAMILDVDLICSKTVKSLLFSQIMGIGVEPSNKEQFILTREEQFIPLARVMATDLPTKTIKAFLECKRNEASHSREASRIVQGPVADVANLYFMATIPYHYLMEVYGPYPFMKIESETCQSHTKYDEWSEITVSHDDSIALKGKIMNTIKAIISKIPINIDGNNLQEATMNAHQALGSIKDIPELGLDPTELTKGVDWVNTMSSSSLTAVSSDSLASKNFPETDLQPCLSRATSALAEIPSFLKATKHCKRTWRAHQERAVLRTLAMGVTRIAKYISDLKREVEARQLNNMLSETETELANKLWAESSKPEVKKAMIKVIKKAIPELPTSVCPYPEASRGAGGEVVDQENSRSERLPTNPGSISSVVKQKTQTKTTKKTKKKTRPDNNAWKKPEQTTVAEEQSIEPISNQNNNVDARPEEVMQLPATSNSSAPLEAGQATTPAKIMSFESLHGKNVIKPWWQEWQNECGKEDCKVNSYRLYVPDIPETNISHARVKPSVKQVHGQKGQ